MSEQWKEREELWKWQAKAHKACSGLEDPERDLRGLVEAAKGFAEWLRGMGHTNKPRASRVPRKLLETLESALSKFKESE